MPAATAGGWRRRVAFAAGVAWTLPNSLLGLLAGLAAMPGGARAHLSRRDLALVFDGVPFGPGGALTLGNVILHTGDSLDADCLTYSHRAGHGACDPVRLGDHERAHVLQYMALGPLFLPLYFLCGGIGVRNRFERSADRYAATGRGWWPWPAPPLGAHPHAAGAAHPIPRESDGKMADHPPPDERPDRFTSR